ncbi:MAG: YgiQ family radical SAM protein [Desulfovibrionaceae bacterium]|nr:YgiQ family radical SAM protein [Desulfovibrionaceae bacterium]
MFTLDLPQRTPLEQPQFLPVSEQDLNDLGWNELDILLISGDAYVDHPSFGLPLLGRWLIAHGFRTGLIAQPDWKKTSSVTAMGRPRLFAGIGSGALDSMLAHYTAFRRRRHDDAFTPGGLTGARPDRAVTVYASLLRRAFPRLPLVAGGIEASLRRNTHYDFWSDSIHPSILMTADIDCVIFGMGERAILEIARRLDAVSELIGDLEACAAPPGDLWPDLWSGIRGTAVAVPAASAPQGETFLELPSHREILRDPQQLLTATLIAERETHQARRTLVQRCGDRAAIIFPPADPLTSEEMDQLYDLPFTRRAHPAYTERIPAEEMIRTSITSHRGCGGGCSFCSIALHQTRRIASRSAQSILKEAARITALPGGRSISDVGGPSANMWRASCAADPSKCVKTSCLFPKICPNFKTRQQDCINLLREIQNIEGIRSVRIASGIRFDLALCDPRAAEAYAGEFTGGQLKIAPEHCSPSVLRLMRKPDMHLFEQFLNEFRRYSEAKGKEQYVIPYLMSAFPGCTDADMQELSAWLAARHWSPKQVQCFIPTPGTVASAMFWCGMDPDGNKIFVARSDDQRRHQHDLLLHPSADRHRDAPHKLGNAPRRTPKSRGRRAAYAGKNHFS